MSRNVGWRCSPRVKQGACQTRSNAKIWRLRARVITTTSTRHACICGFAAIPNNLSKMADRSVVSASCRPARGRYRGQLGMGKQSFPLRRARPSAVPNSHARVRNVSRARGTSRRAGPNARHARTTSVEPSNSGANRSIAPCCPPRGCPTLALPHARAALTHGVRTLLGFEAPTLRSAVVAGQERLLAGSARAGGDAALSCLNVADRS